MYPISLVPFRYVISALVYFAEKSTFKNNKLISFNFLEPIICELISVGKSNRIKKNFFLNFSLNRIIFVGYKCVKT